MAYLLHFMHLMFYNIMSYVSSEVKGRLALFALETAGVDVGQKCV